MPSLPPLSPRVATPKVRTRALHVRLTWRTGGWRMTALSSTVRSRAAMHDSSMHAPAVGGHGRQCPPPVSPGESLLIHRRAIDPLDPLSRLCGRPYGHLGASACCASNTACDGMAPFPRFTFRTSGDVVARGVAVEGRQCGDTPAVLDSRPGRSRLDGCTLRQACPATGRPPRVPRQLLGGEQSTVSISPRSCCRAP